MFSLVSFVQFMFNYSVDVNSQYNQAYFAIQILKWSESLELEYG